MATKMTEWTSELRQITKDQAVGGQRSKNATTAVQFVYDRNGLRGYLGNVSLMEWGTQMKMGVFGAPMGIISCG